MTTNNHKTENQKGQKTSKKTGGTKKGNKHRRGLNNPDLYEKYKIWRSLPTLWKGMKREELVEKFGIEDESMLELLECKTQGKFAEKHGITIETTTDWNHRMEKDGFDHLEEIRKWADKLTKNVTLAHYNKLIRKFDPVSADIWYKTIAGFSEKKLIQHSGKLSLLDLAKQIDDEERQLTEKNNTEDQD